MIIDFADKETEKVFNQEFSKSFPNNIQKIALRKLIMLDNASGVIDVRVPPSNHLEKLSGKLSGKWSIRINDQWRICFIPSDDWKEYRSVEIIDYH
jgi:proteic killer suppression protein